MTSLFGTFFALFLTLLGGGLVSLGLRIWTSRRSTFRAAKDVSSTLQNIINGDINPVHSGIRDYRVACGVAVDLKTGEWISQGRVSDEVIHGVIK